MQPEKASLTNMPSFKSEKLPGAASANANRLASRPAVGSKASGAPKAGKLPLPGGRSDNKRSRDHDKDKNHNQRDSSAQLSRAKGQVHVFGQRSIGKKRFPAEKWTSPQLGPTRPPLPTAKQGCSPASGRMSVDLKRLWHRLGLLR